MSAEPIMSADRGHAYSGGTLSERGERAAVVASGKAAATVPTPRSESVQFTARRCYGNTGEWATLEEPRCVEVARWPTQEAAEAYAYALGRWLDARPQPDSVAPFFAPEMPTDGPGWPELERILENMLRPETP